MNKQIQLFLYMNCIKIIHQNFIVFLEFKKKKELKISKRGNSIKLYVNNTEVYSSSFMRFMGDKVGIAIYANQKISIDYFKVTEKSSSFNTDFTNTNNNSSGSK